MTKTSALRSIHASLLLALAVVGSRPAAGQSMSPDAIGYLNASLRPGFTLFSNPLLAQDDTLAGLMPNAPEGSVVLKWGAGASNSIPEPQATTIRNWLTNFPGGAIAVDNFGKITASFTNGVLKLSWTGTLKTATNVTGPYATVTATNQPLEIRTTELRRFWWALGNSTNQSSGGLSLGQFTAAVMENGQWTDPTLTLDPGEGAVFYNPGTNRFLATFVGTVEEGTLTNAIPQGLSLVSSMVPQAGGVTTKLALTPNTGDQALLWDGAAFQTHTFQSDGSWSPSEPQIPVAGAFFIRAGQPFVWKRTFSTNP